MTESFDPLEAELRALQPRGVSADMRHKIADRLAASSRFPWVRSRRTLLAIGAIAAGVLAAVLVLRSDPTPEAHQADVPPENRTPPFFPAAADEALPTLQVYSRALTGSREDLNALLDRHAGLGVQVNLGHERLFAFTRSGDGIHPLAGDL